jgi:hypothetical protein
MKQYFRRNDMDSQLETPTIADKFASSGPAPSGDPKWAAIVDDVLIPLPRRCLPGRAILAQAGKPERSLIRDYNQPADAPLDPALGIDLAEGNVFRTASSCDPLPAGPLTAPPKLAFIFDDAWKITINPRQTLTSLRDLLGLPADTVLFRDFESPNDQPVLPDRPVLFADGPVFRSQIMKITVKVNNNDVVFPRSRQTGLSIKTTAIEQGVPIQPQFLLYKAKPDESLSPAIPDDERVFLKCGDEFVCSAADDNS